jgi:WhiB family redox-sensing transcriptional regulator
VTFGTRIRRFGLTTDRSEHPPAPAGASVPSLLMAATATPEPPTGVSLIELAIGAGLRVGDQRWRRRAACAGVDPAVFAIERGQSPEPAFAYCRVCEVRAECLQHALDLGQKAFGVWGNTTARTRREAKRRGLSAAELLAELDR